MKIKMRFYTDHVAKKQVPIKKDATPEGMAKI
jgi:hypothetical protein